MFQSENVYGMVTKFGVRVKDKREADRNHILEVVFQLPLSPELADEISPAMAHHLFINVAGKKKPSTDITEGVFPIEVKTYRMQVRTHPELDPEVTIEGVQLRKIRAKKIEGGVWALIFTAGWTMAGEKEATALIKRLTLGVYITMRVMQAALDLQTDSPASDEGQVATVDKSGTVVSITTKKRGGRSEKPKADKPKRGGRGRKTPEDIAREQLAGNGVTEPADVAGDDDGADRDPADDEVTEVSPTTHH